MSRPARIRQPHAERLMQTLSDRDWSIMDTLSRVRLAAGAQLDRLHFASLSPRSRLVMRWRVLKRLVDVGILFPLNRRIGTAQHGSDKLCYALDSAGQRLLQLRANRESATAPIRRPRVPGERFIAHVLAVSEMYVSLVEHSRLGRFNLDDFQAEPAAWLRDGTGGWLKPDGFAMLSRNEVSDYWWLEVDMATESLPTLQAKLLTYLDFVTRGQVGPDGIVPRVLIGVPDEKRRLAVQRVVNELAEPAAYLFRVTYLADAAIVMEEALIDA